MRDFEEINVRVSVPKKRNRKQYLRLLKNNTLARERAMKKPLWKMQLAHWRGKK